MLPTITKSKDFFLIIDILDSSDSATIVSIFNLLHAFTNVDFSSLSIIKGMDAKISYFFLLRISSITGIKLGK